MAGLCFIGVNNVSRKIKINLIAECDKIRHKYNYNGGVPIDKVEIRQYLQIIKSI